MSRHSDLGVWQLRMLLWERALFTHKNNSSVMKLTANLFSSDLIKKM